MKPQVIDNFLPEDLFVKLQTEYNNPYMRYGWIAHPENDPHGHWNRDFANAGAFNLADISDRIQGTIKECWEYAKPHLDNNILIRCYMNGHTYGTDGYFHMDSLGDNTRTNEYTVVIYLNDKWDLDWGGETIFAENDEIIFSSIPKRNRAVIFNGNIPHCARGVSRKFMGLRKTFMFKTREPRSNNFEKLSKFVYSKGAANKSHEVGTLHDHLVRVFQILENKKLPEHVCFAGGLHSVYGTNVFTDAILGQSDRKEVGDVFGNDAELLASLFSVIDRPNTLVTPLEIREDEVYLKLNDGNIVSISHETLKELRYIECANLLDQDSLKKYPTLNSLWYQDVQ
jgi:hypothetical protein